MLSLYFPPAFFFVLKSTISQLLLNNISTFPFWEMYNRMTKQWQTSIICKL